MIVILCALEGCEGAKGLVVRREDWRCLAVARGSAWLWRFLHSHQSIVGWRGSRCMPSRGYGGPTWKKAGLCMLFVESGNRVPGFCIDMNRCSIASAFKVGILVCGHRPFYF